MRKNTKRIVPILFAVYGIIMLCLLFCRSSGAFSEINLIPFKTIGKFWIVMCQSFGVEWAEALFMHSLINLAGNVVMFIPLGFFPPLLWKHYRRFWPDMALCAAVIIAVELLQFITGLGSADVDDFILNIFGAALGWIAQNVFKRAKPESV